MSFLLPNHEAGCALGQDRVTTIAEEKPRELRRIESWLLRHRRDSSPPPVGGQGVMILETGAVLVGTVLRHEPLVLLRLVGSRKITSASPARIKALFPVPAHTYEERRQIAERQQRGEPALLLVSKDEK